MPEFDGYMSGKSYLDKGYDLANIADKLGDDAVKLDGDGKAFDSTQHIEIKRLVDDYIYKGVIKKMEKMNLPYPLWAIKEALLNHKATISYEVRMPLMPKPKKLVSLTHEGTVHTGDMDTSFANTMRMLFYMRTVAKIAGLESRDYAIQVAGDDNSLYVRRYIYVKKEKEIISAYQQIFTNRFEGVNVGLGQVIKFLKKGTIEQGDFCSTNCFKTTRNGKTFYRVIRIPDRYFKKFAHMSAGELHPLEWLYTTGEADLNWAKGLPIFEKLCVWRMKNGKVPTPISSKMMNKPELAIRTLTEQENDFCKMWNVEQRNLNIKNRFHKTLVLKDKLYKSNHEPQDTKFFLEWLCDNYNIEKHEVEDFEKYIDNLSITDTIMNHPVLKKFGNPKPQEDLTKKFSDQFLFRNRNPGFSEDIFVQAYNQAISNH